MAHKDCCLDVALGFWGMSLDSALKSSSYLMPDAPPGLDVFTFFDPGFGIAFIGGKELVEINSEWVEYFFGSGGMTEQDVPQYRQVLISSPKDHFNCTWKEKPNTPTGLCLMSIRQAVMAAAVFRAVNKRPLFRSITLRTCTTMSGSSNERLTITQDSHSVVYILSFADTEKDAGMGTAIQVQIGYEPP